jgi:hypothetical protein
MRPVRWIVVGALLGAACAHASPLNSAERSTPLVKLFGAGEKSTPSAVAAARAEFDRLKKTYPNDSRIDYAYGVVLANQHRYREMAPLVSTYVETSPDDLAARRTGIWARIQDKKYTDALDEAVAVGRLLSKTKSAQPNDENVETARFLGQLFGYFELARPGIVDAKEALERKNQILLAIGQRYLTEFDRGRDAVAEQVDKLEEQRDAERKQAAAMAERSKELAKSAVDDERKAIADEQDAMQSSHAQMVDAERELTTLRNQLHSLQRDRSRLTAQIIAAQALYTQLASTQVSTQTAENIVPGRGPVRQEIVDTQQISPTRFAQASAAAMQLALLNKQAFEMDRRILALESRAAEVGNNGMKEREALDEGQERVRRAERHVKGAQQKLRRNAPPSTARANALSAKIASFTTYFPFDYDVETKRVLGWFSK